MISDDQIRLARLRIMFRSLDCQTGGTHETRGVKERYTFMRTDCEEQEDNCIGRLSFQNLSLSS
jgi:hypothetical protein